MKKTFLSLALVLFAAVTISAQSVTPPASANTHLQKNWAGAAKISWSHAAGHYVAQFSSGDHTMFAYYDESGNFEKSKTQVLWAEVPAEVMRAHKTSVNNIYPPIRQYKVDTQGAVSWELILKNSSSQEVMMSFDPAGHLLGESVNTSGN